VIRFREFEQFGVSIAAFSSKDDGDCRRGKAGRTRFCNTCGVSPEHLVCANQVHGAGIARVDERDRGQGALDAGTAIPETDGLVTDVPGLPLTLLVADCVPVYLFDEARRAVGLVHAGRRGTAAGIASEAVDALRREFGTDPSDVHALIGPSAGPSAYEVSHEMAEEWRALGLPASGRRLDLWSANVQQLVEAGIPRERVVVTGCCTIEDGRFYSHRREPDGRRNMALMMI